MSAAKAEDLREKAFALTCHEQFRLATFIAENVGYVLAPEPSFDDGPEQRLSDVRASLLKELDDIFDGAKVMSCTRLSLAIEALIDAKLGKPA